MPDKTCGDQSACGTYTGMCHAVHCLEYVLLNLDNNHWPSGATSHVTQQLGALHVNHLQHQRWGTFGQLHRLAELLPAHHGHEVDGGKRHDGTKAATTCRPMLPPKEAGDCGPGLMSKDVARWLFPALWPPAGNECEDGPCT